MTPNEIDAAKLVAELRAALEQLRWALPGGLNGKGLAAFAELDRSAKQAAAFIEAHSTPTEYDEGALREIEAELPLRCIRGPSDKVKVLAERRAQAERIYARIATRLSQVTAERDEAVKLLAESQESIGGDWRQRRDYVVSALSHISKKEPTEEQSAGAGETEQ